MAEEQVTALSSPNFEAWVSVDGRRAPVYGATEFEEQKATGYIESKDGGKFTIHCKLLGQENPEWDTAIEFLVDGSLEGDLIVRSDAQCYRWPLENHAARTRSLTGRRVGPRSLHPFLFNQVSLTADEDEANSGEHFIRNVGSIEIRITREVVVSVSDQPEFQAAPSASSIYENSVKANVSHQTSHGEAMDVPQINGTFTRPYIYGEKPICTFKFLYLSKDLLRMKGFTPIKELENKPDIKPDIKPPVNGSPKGKRKEIAPVPGPAPPPPPPPFAAAEKQNGGEKAAPPAGEKSPPTPTAISAKRPFASDIPQVQPQPQAGPSTPRLSAVPPSPSKSLSPASSARLQALTEENQKLQEELEAARLEEENERMRNELQELRERRQKRVKKEE